ncbi:uncharacterized protein [Argopecten irradians]|uniref:uncharacterized protein n=1 Tax=Argopecten irradians TaxID=31199 RepID=UPI00371DAD44
MESASSKVFALIQWEDLFFDVLDTTRILHPRKALDSYVEGEYVKARYHGKIYSAIICELGTDRSALLTKAKDSSYSQRNKFPYVAQAGGNHETNVTQLNSVEQNKPIITIDQGIVEPATPSAPKNLDVAIKKPVTVRPEKRKLETTVELKQAKAAESMGEKMKTKDRDAASASLLALLDEEDGPSHLDILLNIQKKVSSTSEHETKTKDMLQIIQRKVYDIFVLFFFFFFFTMEKYKDFMLCTPTYIAR